LFVTPKWHEKSGELGPTSAEGLGNQGSLPRHLEPARAFYDALAEVIAAAVLQALSSPVVEKGKQQARRKRGLKRGR